MRLRALLSEAWAGVLQRPSRSILTMLGTVLGIGSFVAILGVSQTANGQISKDFNLISATQVTVKDVAAEKSQAPGLSFPDDAQRRVTALNGATSGGVWWRVPLGDGTIAPRPAASVNDSFQGDTFAATPSLVSAAGVHVTSGVTFNDYHESASANVILLSQITAGKLGVRSAAGQPTVFIDGYPFVVIGIYDNAERIASLALGAIMPTHTARKYWGLPHSDSPAQMLVVTRPGAASLVATQVPLALLPAAPSALQASAPPDAKSLRANVQQNLNTLLVLLAAVSTIIGALGIANTSLVAVMERTAEIGLRRSLGGLRRHIAAQFLIESGILGLLGGLLGASGGVWVVLGITWERNWTAVLSPLPLLLAPAAGAVIGILAGIYPAWRAADVEPAEAVRR